MTDHLPDANVSIGPMIWCNHCQQNVGGAIKHKAGCRESPDAPVSPDRLDELINAFYGGGTSETWLYPCDVEGIINDRVDDEIESALRELKALREQCEWQREALEWYTNAEPVELHRTDEILEYQCRARECLSGGAHD